jgi:ligand-binding sensor domain-containing protein
MKKLIVVFLSLAFLNIFSQTPQWKFYSPEEIGITADKIISAIEIDTLNNTIWFGTRRAGLIKLKDNQFKVFNKDNSNLANPNIWAMKTDSSGNLFLATGDTGLVKFDGNSFVYFDVTQVAPQAHANALWEVEIDKYGNLWGGSYWGGLLKLSGDQWTYYDDTNSPLPNNMLEINTIAIDDSGNIWFGTDNDGVGKFNGENEWTFYENFSWWVYSIAIDEDGVIWASGSDVKYFNGQTWIFVHDALSDARFSTYAIAFDLSNNKWFPNAPDGKGLLKYNENGFQEIEPAEFPDSLGKPYSLQIDSQNNIWIGYINGYIAYYDQNEVTAYSHDPVPIEFELEQNYPNPFNPLTTIRFDLPENANVKLKVYNLLGEEIATLFNGDMSSGYHSFDWNASRDGRQLSSGVYFYSIDAIGTSGKKFISTKKMILLK